MKNNKIALSIIPMLVSFQIVSAQVAKQKGITVDRIQQHLDSLIYKRDTDSKNMLANELKILGNSRKENFMSIAAEVYGYLGMHDEETAVQSLIIKRFPKGIRARDQAYLKFAENTSLIASDTERQYNYWLSAFPILKYKEYEREIYNVALADLAAKFGRDNNHERFYYYLDQLRSKPNFLKYLSEISSVLCSAGNFKMALPILEEGFNLSKASGGAEDSNYSYYQDDIKWNYAKALIEVGETAKGLTLFEQYEAEKPGAGNYDWRNKALYAKGLNDSGKRIEAFQVIQKYLTEHGRNGELEKMQKDIYCRINGDGGDYNSYLTTLIEVIDKIQFEKIKSKMIKKEAPMFNLEDRAGKQVSLADLKGKVVVLDFWATWCGPCKASFPAMQAAINKYKDDNDVAFLFINTGERAKNYREMVNEYIESNKYSFHVLFDEMADRSKATATAYGIIGIPTKVIIDSEGFIRFQFGGSEAEIDKEVSELSAKIELAKRG